MKFSIASLFGFTAFAAVVTAIAQVAPSWSFRIILVSLSILIGLFLESLASNEKEGPIWPGASLLVFGSFCFAICIADQIWQLLPEWSFSEESTIRFGILAMIFGIVLCPGKKRKLIGFVYCICVVIICVISLLAYSFKFL